MKILNYKINFPVRFPSINYEWINFVEKISRRIPRKDIWFSSLFGIDFTYNFDKRWKSNINIYIYQLDLFINRPSKGVNDLSKNISQDWDSRQKRVYRKYFTNNLYLAVIRTPIGNDWFRP